MAVRNGINLGSAKPLSLGSRFATIRGKLNRQNQDDIYQFNLSQRSSLGAKLQSSSSTSNLELIYDRNSNGQLNAGEVLSQSRARDSKAGSLDLNDAEPGTYYLRVSGGKGKKGNYRLRLGKKKGSANDTNVSPVEPLNPLVTQVLNLTNAYRQQNGLPALTFNNKLISAAQKHSRDMALNDYFSHYGLNGSTPFDRIKAEGYRYSSAAENIAAGYFTAEEVVQAWIDSPGHRENLLRASVKQIGIGYFYLANDTGKLNFNTYWTQSFGTPK